MRPDFADASAEGVTAAEAEAALAHLIRDEHFVASERTKSLLTYLGREALAGRADRIKAYSIAIDFLGRNENFDATTDSIVRVEASRLRSALHAYNQRAPMLSAVRIDLPRGSYVPTFERVQLNDEHGASQGEPPSPGPVKRNGNSPRTKWLIVGAVAVSLMAGASVMHFQISGAPTVVARPLLEISIEGSATDVALPVARIQFERAIIQQETVRLLDSDVPIVHQANVNIVRSSYKLLISLATQDRFPAVQWRLSSVTSGEVLASGMEVSLGVTPDDVARSMHRIARSVAGADGIIPTTELTRHFDDDLGYPCVRRADQATVTRFPAALMAARKCLERTLAAGERNTDAQAALGTVLMFLNRVNRNPEDLRLALFHSDKAAALAPSSGLAAVAQAVSLYQSGQFGAATAAARRAVELGPTNPSVLSRGSAAIYFSGNWEEGLKVANQAMNDTGTMKPAGASLVLALEAYRNAEYATAIDRVDAVAKPDPATILVKLSALHQLGRHEEVARVYRNAVSQYPEFSKVLVSVADSSRFGQTLINNWREPLLEIEKSYGKPANARSEAFVSAKAGF